MKIEKDHSVVILDTVLETWESHFGLNKSAGKAWLWISLKAKGQKDV